MRRLGYEMMKGPCCKGDGIIDIFLTHNHWDHIQGLPFFIPIYIPGNVFNFYSPFKNQEELLKVQMTAPQLFPVTLDQTPPKKNFIYLDTRERKTIILEDDLIVDYYPLKHPGGSFAYRFRQNGRTFVFATDAEFTGESIEKNGTGSEFFHNADLLILDAQYTLDESFAKFDWGHTSQTMAVNCGIRWNIKHLVLTHHEPAYSDQKLYENYLVALEHRRLTGNKNPRIYIAREGLTFKL